MKRSLGKAMLIAMALGLVLLTPLRAQPQTLVGFGPTAGYSIDGSEPFIGALVRIAPPVMLGQNMPLMFDGGFEYYFDVEGATLFTIGATGLTQFAIQNSQVKPHVGAGLSFTRVSFDVDTGLGSFSGSDTSIHLQLQGGIMVNIVSVDGLVRIGDGSDLILRGAVLFGSLMK